MPFDIDILNSLLKSDDIKRLINIEYKNQADREFVSYFLKKNQRLPALEEILYA